MTVLLRVVIAGGAWLVAERVRPRYANVAALAVFAALLVPVPTLVGAAGFGMLMLRRRLATKRTQAEASQADVTVLSELTLLGLSGGLTFSASLDQAAGHVVGPLQREVRGVLRKASLSGVAAGFGLASGDAAGLYHIAGRAAVTGASVSSAVAGFVDERRAVEAAEALAKARRLPVRLLFPLALLILPGFMVLTVGPAVVGAVARLTM